MPLNVSQIKHAVPSLLYLLVYVREYDILYIQEAQLLRDMPC